LRHQL